MQEHTLGCCWWLGPLGLSVSSRAGNWFDYSQAHQAAVHHVHCPLCFVQVSAAWSDGRLQVVSLPFSSSFNQGQGLARFSGGVPQQLGGWWDLSAQDMLPPLGATGIQVKQAATKEFAKVGFGV